MPESPPLFPALGVGAPAALSAAEFLVDGFTDEIGAILNGWGDHEGAASYLEWLLTECRKHPKTSIRVYC